MNSLMHSRIWLLLGWSILHYLWVGAALLVAAGAARLLLRRCARNVRYAVALLALLMLAVAPVLIYETLAPRSLAAFETLPAEVAQQPIDVPAALVGSIDELRGSLRTTKPIAKPATEGAPDLATIAAMIRRAGQLGAAYLPWLWIAGCPFTAIYLLAGISGAGRLKQRAVLASEPAVTAVLDRLARELGVAGRAVIGLSSRVVAPLVVGIARPMILLPPALLASWNPDELELILLHELAHVRRWDNLVNLLQRVVEAALFFHPAVWIVSRWARLEREQCCDEIVLRHRDAPQKYAETLAALAAPGISPAHAAAAMANHQLVARIRNILNVEDRTMRFSTRSVLAATGLIGVLVSLLFIAGPLAASDQEKPTGDAASNADKLDQGKQPIETRRYNVRDLVQDPLSGAKEVISTDLANPPTHIRGTVSADDISINALGGVVVDSATGKLVTAYKKRAWGPEQACGPPDTAQAGDLPTAWASASPDGQEEFLDLYFSKPIDTVAVVVYENNAPGAITHILVLDDSGNPFENHTVSDPTPTQAPSGVSVFPLVAKTRGIRLILDSQNVPGWNEIDAVGLLDKKGEIHWAETAAASSTFADVVDPPQATGQAPILMWSVTPRLTSESAQEFLDDPELKRLRANIQQLEPAAKSVDSRGDASQQELAKNRNRRARLRLELLNEEVKERVEQIRQQQAGLRQMIQIYTQLSAGGANAQRALDAERQAKVNVEKAEADRAVAQEQLNATSESNHKPQDAAALANRADAKMQQALASQKQAEAIAAKLEADRAQASARLKAYADESRKLQDALAVAKQNEAAAQQALFAEKLAKANSEKAYAEQAQAKAQLKAATDAIRDLQEALAVAKREAAETRSKQDQGAGQYPEINPGMDRQNLRAIIEMDAHDVTAVKQSLDVTADKLLHEMKQLDLEFQKASEPARAELRAQAHKLHEQLSTVEATIKQLDKSLSSETDRATVGEDSLRAKAAATLEQKAAIQRIEQLESAVQELRRSQESKLAPPGNIQLRKQ